MTNPRPPAPADPWKDVTKLQASLVRDRYEWVYFASDVDAARLATEQQHQQEIAEAQQVLAARRRVRDSFKHRDENGKCQCVYCAKDVEGLTEHAADYELQAWSARKRIEALEQHTARLRAALRDAARETAKLAATFDTNTDETKATDANV